VTTFLSSSDYFATKTTDIRKAFRRKLEWGEGGERKVFPCKQVVVMSPLTSLRHTYLGSFFLDPEDITKLSIGAIWNFAKGTGLL
jgi:hypothetical protein